MEGCEGGRKFGPGVKKEGKRSQSGKILTRRGKSLTGREEEE